MLATDLGFVLKSEQKEAFVSLLMGRNVIGVLPKSFGKFQLFVLVKSRSSSSVNAFDQMADIVILLLSIFL